MPQTTLEQRRSMSEQELRSRAAEMRNEWGEASWGQRESETFAAARRQFINEVTDIDDLLTLRQIEATPPAPRQAPPGVFNDGVRSDEYKTAGQSVIENEAFRAWMQQEAGRDHIAPSPVVQVESLRTLVATNDGAGTDLLMPVQQPVIRGIDRNRYVMRDLLTVLPTNAAAISFVRELNSATNATTASTVAEAATKPEAAIEFEDDLAPIQVIAVWIPMTRQSLEDVPAFPAYIDSRLRYMLELREDQQILSGAGTGADLKGLLNQTGLQTQSTAGAGEYALTIGRAISKIEVVNGQANGVAMNTASAWEMFIHRAGGAGAAAGFDAGTPFSNIPLSVWGLPVVRTNSLATNRALVGDFRQGAGLYDRRQVSVRMYEQHSDYVIKNKVLLLAEERVGLAVWRPDHFVLATTS